jgi:hypothetical protein
MADWAFKTTGAKLDRDGTANLAFLDGFIARSRYFLIAGRMQAVPRVADVALGDVIHLYYREKSKSFALGAYEVITPDAHPEAPRFGDRVEGTALFRVTDPAFVVRRDPNGAYKFDPQLGCFTGWVVRRQGHARPYPSVEGLFGMRQTLVKIS